MSIKTMSKINKLTENYNDRKITRIEFEKELKIIGINSLIKFIIDEV